MQEWPCTATLEQLGRAGGISWHCTPGTAKGAASTGLECSWDPALEVSPGENLAGSFPTLQQLQRSRGWVGRCPLLHMGCSAGSREQQGSWEWSRKVQVTQIFLAQSTAGGSWERGGQIGRSGVWPENCGAQRGDEGPGDTISGHWRKEGQEGARPPGVVGPGMVTRGATWTLVS